MSKGKIIQVMGPVVDVAFEDDGLPHIKDALVVDNQGKKCVMEVAPVSYTHLFFVAAVSPNLIAPQTEQYGGFMKYIKNLAAEVKA